MALESLPKIAPALFSADQDLIQIYNKKTDTLGVINPSYIKSSPSGVAGAIQFSDGSAFASDASNLFWDNVNKRLGLGTNTPTAQLTVNTTDFVIGANAGYSTYYGSSVNGSFQIKPSGQNTQLFIRPSTGAVSYNSAYWSRIQNTPFTTEIAMGEYQSYLSLGKTSVPQMASLFNNGNFVFGSSSDLSARVGIKGSGSTSATTSLLVQNSGGTNLLQQKDNGELWIGTTASGLGKILVPHDSAYGQRVFMGIQAGVNLMATQSNDGLVFKANYNIFDGAIFNNSGGFYGANTGSGTDTNAYNLATQLQPVGGANSNLINLSGGGRLQGSATGNYIQVSGNMQVDSTANILRGFYFNPTLSGAYSNANVFAVHSTYGGAYLNTATPNASAILQADSTTQGFLPPRMTDAQVRAIASPAVGLMAFNTDLDCPVFYSAAGWRKVSHSVM